MGAVIGPPLFNLIPEILSSNNDQKPKKSSPKRQKCDEAQVISSPRQRRINKHQWIPSTETQMDFYNHAKAMSTMIVALQCSGIENNELIIRIGIPNNPS